MAVNRDRRVEVLIRERAFIQKCMFISGPTVAGYLLQLELITRRQYENVQRSDSLSLMMRAVELKVESDPDLYFPRFIQALRWSYLDYLADMLEQQARALPEQEVPGIYSVCRALITICTFIRLLLYHMI